MSTNNSITQFGLIAAISFILTGCGGSGGNLAQQDTPTIPEQPSSPTPSYGTLSLTSDNFDDYSLLFNRGLYNEINNIRNSYHLPTPSVSRLTQSLWLSPAVPTSVKTAFIDSLPTTAGTHNCSSSGSMTRVLNDTNADGQITLVGESVSITFNNCSNGSLIANGSLGYRITAITSTTQSVSLSYTGLTTQQGSNSNSYAGDKTLSIDSTSGLLVSSQPSSDVVSTTVVNGSSTQTTQKTNYRISYQEIGTEWQASLAGNMDLLINNDKAMLGFTTSTPLTGSIGSGVYGAPRTGDYTTSWNSQGLKTTSNADGLLTMSADIDSNGSYEVSYQQSWDRLVIPE